MLMVKSVLGLRCMKSIARSFMSSPTNATPLSTSPPYAGSHSSGKASSRSALPASKASGQRE